MVWILGVWAVLGVLTFIILCHIPKASRSNWKPYKRHVNPNETNCWRLWATWPFTERYKHFHGLLLHVHSSGWWLFDKNITCIGAINSNWKGLPKETKETKGREENSWISCKSDKGEVTLNLYVMKAKSSGMRNVLLLQTTNPAHYVTQDDKKSLLVTRHMTTLRVELIYPVKEWGHILQNVTQENGR